MNGTSEWLLSSTLPFNADDRPGSLPGNRGPPPSSHSALPVNRSCSDGRASHWAARAVLEGFQANPRLRLLRDSGWLEIQGP